MATRTRRTRKRVLTPVNTLRTLTIGELVGDVPMWPRTEARFLFSCREKRAAELSNDQACELGFVALLLSELARRDRKRSVERRLRMVVEAIHLVSDTGWAIPWGTLKRRSREMADEYAFLRGVMRSAERRGVPLRDLAEIARAPGMLGVMRLAEPKNGTASA